LAVVKAAVVASTIFPSASPFGVTTGELSGATSVVISDPLPVDLYVYRGDSGRFRVAINDPDGAPLDVSGATWDCDIRTQYDADPPIVSLDVNPIDASTVEVVLNTTMSALLVDNAVWDLEMTLNGEVQTLLSGVVHVHKDVSRS
jgi:hypothetical protein